MSDRSPAPRSRGWAEPAEQLKREGPGCERGAQRLLWLLSARDAGDPAVWSRRRALKDVHSRQPFILEEGKCRSDRFREVTSGLLKRDLQGELSFQAPAALRDAVAIFC